MIDNSAQRVEDGAVLVEGAGKAMEEIVEAVKRVTDLMGEMRAATEEQTGGIEQVNQAVSQMDQMAQQNAALVEKPPPPRPRWRIRLMRCTAVGEHGRTRFRCGQFAPLSSLARAEHRWNMLTTKPRPTKKRRRRRFYSIDDSLTGYLLFVLFIAENCWVR
jgi:hypothetical protein